VRAENNVSHGIDIATTRIFGTRAVITSRNEKTKTAISKYFIPSSEGIYIFARPIIVYAIYNIK